MDITGARWGVPAAEAILKLRALHANGDFDDYWAYHLHREHQRNHPAQLRPRRLMLTPKETHPCAIGVVVPAAATAPVRHWCRWDGTGAPWVSFLVRK